MATVSTTGTGLTPAEQRKLLKQGLKGSAFDPFQRVFGSFEGGAVFDYAEVSAARVAEMLARDGKARATEQVITLPLRGAPHKVEPAEGDTGQADLVTAVLGDQLERIIDQMTTALAYTRAFFECSWTRGTGEQDGKIVYDEIAFRPATGCEPGFDPQTGKPKGFRQRIVPVAGIFPKNYTGTTPGYVTVDPLHAFIYTHGAFRDPVKGVSELAVALWSYETKQKVLFLLFSYLENQAQPKTVVYGSDQTEATERANDVAQLKGAGVLGLERAPDNGKAFDVLESSGAGAAQFMNAIAYLDTMIVSSVLAGFTELSSPGSSGSYALSADQSEFFLASRQADADEIADAIREGLFRPLVLNNYGPDASVPTLSIGPLSNRKTDRALSLLTAVVAAPALNVGGDFVDMLTQSVATYLDLDPDAVKASIEKNAQARAEADQLKIDQQKALLNAQATPNPDGKGGALTGAAAVVAKPKPGPGKAAPDAKPVPGAAKPTGPAKPTGAKPAVKLSDYENAAIELIAAHAGPRSPVPPTP